MVHLRLAGMRYAALVLQFGDLVERCFVPGARLGNVFAVRAPAPRGDGKSRETAYYFPTARTPLETIEFCRAFLSRSGCVVQTREQGGIEGGFVYDVYATDKGAVWFKVLAITG